MLGIEVKELYAKPLLEQKERQSQFRINKIIIEKQEKVNIVECQSVLGDIIKMKFNSQYRDQYARLAADLWFNTIMEYEIVDEGIYIEPQVYWNIYKNFPNGKSYLQGVGYKLTINDIPYTFVPRDYYFKDRNPAVYGLYYNDELIYIGSTANYHQRWGEHYLDFKTHSLTNEMYRQLSNVVDEIEFKILYDPIQVKKLAQDEEITMYEYEIVEKNCIEHYKPRYNKEGVVTPFRFQAKSPKSSKSYKMALNIEKNLTFN